nr:hypothetical protein [Tanacetum cinerariifolium]
MAFSPYNRPPQLIDFLNLFLKDCPSTVMSSSFTNLPSEAEPKFIELSLGVKAPVTTSSFIHHSRLLKRKRSTVVNDYQLWLTRVKLARNLLILPGVPKTHSTQPIEEPQKKKRKITPKIKSGPVVKNEVTERLQKFITGDEMNGSEPKLVIQKVLYMSDLKQDQNRLNLPLNKLETEYFLTIEEKLALENEYEIDVRLVGLTLKMYKKPMRVGELNEVGESSGGQVIEPRCVNDKSRDHTFSSASPDRNI